MSIALFCLSGFCFLVAMGTGTAEDRNGWFVASGFYAVAGAIV